VRRILNFIVKKGGAKAVWEWAGRMLGTLHTDSPVIQAAYLFTAGLC
jgi:hypothetical protein